MPACMNTVSSSSSTDGLSSRPADRIAPSGRTLPHRGFSAEGGGDLGAGIAHLAEHVHDFVIAEECMDASARLLGSGLEGHQQVEPLFHARTPIRHVAGLDEHALPPAQRLCSSIRPARCKIAANEVDAPCTSPIATTRGVGCGGAAPGSDGKSAQPGRRPAAGRQEGESSLLFYEDLRARSSL